MSAEVRHLREANANRRSDPRLRLSQCAACFLFISCGTPTWGKVVGAVDERRLPEATFMSSAERHRFSSIGRIECRNGKFENGKPLYNIGTAFHVGSRSVMATAAHTFFYDSGARMPASACQVSYYGPTGGLVETIPVLSVKSRWDEPGLNGDFSNDVALIKLSRPSTSALEAAGVEDSEKLTNITSITCVGFALDLPSDTTLFRVHGIAIRPPNKAQLLEYSRSLRLPFKNPENVAVTNCDANHGTSGAPIYNDSNKIIGLHEGFFGSENEEFDMYASYNRIFVFDRRFMNDAGKLIDER